MSSYTETNQPWLVIYTRPKSEKKLAEQLRSDGIEAYCPTQQVVKQWSDRKKKIEVPLLPSMLLVNVNDNDRYKVFHRQNALRYLFWLGKPAEVTPEEVETLRALVEDSRYENFGLEKLQPGEKLDMTEMGFENVEGTVKFVNDKECWIILENLGYIVKFKKN